MKIKDLPDLVLVQGLKGDHLVYPVVKLWAKGSLDAA